MFSLLFERHPDTRELFGAYSFNQQKQMVHRMLTSVLASLDGEPWLPDDLESLGATHQAYGVTAAMYAQVNDCFIDAVAAVEGGGWTDDLDAMWRSHLTRIGELMHPTADYASYDLLDLDLHTGDPWDFYQWLRDEMPLYWDPTNEIWAVSRYEDVVFVSRRTDLFCSGHGVVPTMSLDIWPDEAMINLDGTAHTCQRGLVAKGFIPKRIAAMESEIREIANRLIDRVETKGEFDLVKDFSRPLPMRIIAGMLGYPEDKIDQVLDWTDAYCMGGCGPAYVDDDVVEAFGNFMDFHEELLAEKKKCPGDDLLNTWMKAELDGKRLSEEKLMYEHNLLLVGGSETTRSAIAIGMQALMEHPDQMAWLKANINDPEILATAIEEMIRWSCPFVRMARTATRDVEMHGKIIEKGQQICVLYPAANRDPRAFVDPDRFDIRRDPENAHLSFGIGKHFCLGASLARLETQIAVEVLLKRLPVLAMKSGRPPVRARTSFVRSLQSLPVEFERAVVAG